MQKISFWALGLFLAALFSTAFVSVTPASAELVSVGQGGDAACLVSDAEAAFGLKTPAELEHDAVTRTRERSSFVAYLNAVRCKSCNSGIVSDGADGSRQVVGSACTNRYKNSSGGGKNVQVVIDDAYYNATGQFVSSVLYTFSQQRDVSNRHGVLTIGDASVHVTCAVIDDVDNYVDKMSMSTRRYADHGGYGNSSWHSHSAASFTAVGLKLDPSKGSIEVIKTVNVGFASKP
ncbi:hypothetical protein COU19_03435 [Candidatus Kaiserbacteria bacterium CG10_big_fil_rev_8_21_14_0_10_56_12]|uniref:Uncharacterized protein n=1 Tax=Candidatus Kaiserbacteria bacterium CG10_big_fil_rev_8_21_14_0_10_56_12 TaxID=1974611 RepID=A0A2H0U900_9BACT|nr:MAG: hypothetical protein COU19_03435 [Candidatus Kaiserbacteria bacterium CG10_big_fil_rev_8_21_14_0_10_56_12]